VAKKPILRHLVAGCQRVQRLIQRNAEGELIGDLTKLRSGRIRTVGCHIAHTPRDGDADPNRAHQHRQSIGKLFEQRPQTPLLAPAVELANEQGPDQRQGQQRRASQQRLHQRHYQSCEEQRGGKNNPPGEWVAVLMRRIEGHQT
jgi:hypothetical protein